MSITSIQIDNAALAFIEKRISDNMYRGGVSSQHNRYDMREIHDTLCILQKYTHKSNLLKIRSVDLSKRAYNTPDEYDYAKFCSEVKGTIERCKGTQDSIRKNIFPDLHRMGLINRYDNNKQLILPYQRKSVKYVSLSDFGLRFIQESNILNQMYIFSKAIDNLLGGFLNTALSILYDSENGIDKLTKYEFMFFVTAVNSDTSFNINIEQCVDLIQAYRKLSTVQSKCVIETLKSQLNPKLYDGNKTDKRDWHNWVNKVDQMFSLFKQTAYFDLFNDDLILKIKKSIDNQGNVKFVCKRSTPVKFEYLKQHTVSKKAGFEFHHVVPLSWAENPEQFKLFDCWKNLIYIDAYSHSMITQNGNSNVVMTADNSNLILSNFNGNAVILEYIKNINYNRELQSVLIGYNQELLNTVGI